MANIFNSREVYKRIPKVSPKDNPLRKVRGVYVTGDYRPPYYIDSSLHITDININKPVIVDFTQVTKSAYDDGSTVSLLSLDCNWDLKLTRYTRAAGSVHDDSTVSMISLDCNKPTITRVPRPKVEANMYDDGSTVSLLDMNCSVGIKFTRYHHQKYKTIPEQLCVIRDIYTSKATIENG